MREMPCQQAERTKRQAIDQHAGQDDVACGISVEQASGVWRTSGYGERCDRKCKRHLRSAPTEFGGKRLQENAKRKDEKRSETDETSAACGSQDQSRMARSQSGGLARI